MSDLNYEVTLDSQSARASLGRLQDTVSATTTAFNRLGTVITSIAAGAFTTQAFAMANSMRDLSAATSISIQSVLGFSQALAANGGSVDRARDGITDLVKNIGQAAGGSKELQSAFAKVGISLNDLRTLSEEDILRKTISGLSELNSKATQSSLAMRLFGESFKGVDIAGLNTGIDGFIQGAGSSATAVDAAGRASQNFKNVVQELQVSLLAVLEPISRVAVAITENKELMTGLINTVQTLAIAFSALFALGKIASVFGAAATAIGRVGTAASAAGLSLTSLRAHLIAASYAGESTSKRLALSAAIILGAFGRMLPVIGQVVAVLTILNEAVRYTFGKSAVDMIVDATNALRNFVLESASINSRISIGVDTDFDDIEAQFAEMHAQWDAAAEKRLTKEGQIREVIVQQAQDLAKSLDTYKQRNSALFDTLRNQHNLIGLSAEEAEYRRTIITFTDEYKARVRDLNAELELLNKNPEENAELISNVLATLQAVTAEYNIQLPVITSIAALIRDKNIAIKQSEENTRKATDAARLYKEEMTRVADGIRGAVDFSSNLQATTIDAGRYLAQLNMDPLQKQIADIQLAVANGLIAELNRLNNLKLTITDPGAIAQIDQQIVQLQKSSMAAIEAQTNLATQTYKQQRSFAQGWADAFKEYKESATDAAKVAGRIFDKTTKGMEDSIVNFAKTGKFEFKSFVNSILEELLRSQVQSLISSLFSLGGSNGTGGAITGLGSLLGFANGGVIPTNGPVLVGERGPEILSGVGGRVVTPNNQLPTANNVTYNINAVDARSFKQLVASDPAFIYSVTQQGAKSVSTTRR